MATTQESANGSTEPELTGAPDAEIAFGREICRNLEIAEQREWLVTNGIGGYASGTVSGNLTRRYHGLLIAALNPPVGRILLVAKLEETAIYAGSEYALATNRWLSGAIEPKGCLNIESFRLEGTTPVWRLALGNTLLEKRIWMRQGENTTYVQYSPLNGNAPVRLSVKALVNYRDFHSSTHAGDWRMEVESVEHGLQVVAFAGATPFYLLTANAGLEPQHVWYHDFFLSMEKARGLDDREDHLLAAASAIELAAGASVTFVLTTNSQAGLDGARAFAEHGDRERKLFSRWSESDSVAAPGAPAWIRQLIL